MILSVNFQHSITALEPWPGGIDWWSAEDDVTKSWNLTCTEKGNALIFEWTSRSQKHKGRRKRLRVPLTNIASVLELEDAPAPKEQP